MTWFNILSNKAGDPKQALKKSKGELLGCMGCPLNSRDNRKVKNLSKVQGRRLMLWGQSPDRAAVLTGIEFKGRTGKWLWKRLKKYGFTRDLFDIQNVVRCRPVSEAGYDRDPAPKEIKHCSVHTSEALQRNSGKAQLHLVFGKVAAKALLGEEYDADTPVLWSEVLDARVICLPHPGYFMSGAPGWRYKQFHERMKAAKYFYAHPGRWHFLKKTCDLQTVGPDGDDAFFDYMYKARKAGQRVALDIEEGTVEGQGRQLLSIAGSWERHKAVCLPLDHPENHMSQAARDVRKARLAAFLGDVGVEKVFQYGVSDLDALKRLLRVRVRGFTFDTTYAHYFIFPFLRSHGLNAIAGDWYPMFGDYKNMVDVSKLAEEPLARVGLYNAADAALTKSIELDYMAEVPLPLMHTYIWAGQTLYEMERRGPLLDLEYVKYVESLIPVRLEKVLKELRMLVGNPNFNPNAPDQVARMLYRKLKLPLPDGEKENSTGVEVLTAIIAATKHPFPELILEFRGLSKMKGTYLDNYILSAKLHDGQVRTRWFLTGAVTGRLRSGGGKEPGVINMQNLHGDLMLQNLLVSDLNWREVRDRIV